MRHLGLLLVAACTSSTPVGDRPSKRTAPAARYTSSRTTWAGSIVTGASGVASRGDDRFFAVPERARFLLPFTVTTRGISVEPRVPLTGVPVDVDIESISTLPNDRIALGTETKKAGRIEDTILLARPANGTFNVTGRLEFSYAGFGIRAGSNRGIEGLCFADDRLLAAAESVVEHNGDRYAPLGSYDFTNRTWAYYRVRLSSDTGKLSALACWKTARNRQVLAIERHYEVMRVLRFSLPLLDGGGDVHPEILVDVASLYPDAPPNFEGLGYLKSGRLLLVADNDYGGAQGPTHIILVEPVSQSDPKLRHGGVVY